MKSSELRKLSELNLTKKITELEEKLFSLRCSVSMGSISNNSVLKQNRKLIARAMTILQEKKNSAIIEKDVTKK